MSRAAPLFLYPHHPSKGNEWNKGSEFLKGCSCWMFSCLLTGGHRRGKSYAYLRLFWSFPSPSWYVRWIKCKRAHQCLSRCFCDEFLMCSFLYQLYSAGVSRRTWKVQQVSDTHTISSYGVRQSKDTKTSSKNILQEILSLCSIHSPWRGMGA